MKGQKSQFPNLGIRVIDQIVGPLKGGRGKVVCSPDRICFLGAVLLNAGSQSPDRDGALT